MTFYKFLDIFSYLIPIILSLGVAVGLYYYRNLNKEYRYILYYVVLCLVTDVTCRIVGTLFKNNLLFIVLFSLFELIFFTLFYQACLFKRKIMRYNIIAFVIAVYICWEISTLWSVNPLEFQTYSRVFSSFLIILMSINFLTERISNEKQNNNLVQLNFIFILFFSLHLIFYLPINFLINVPSSLKFYFWSANILIIVIFYIFLSRLIWKNGLTQKQLQSGL